MEKLIPKPRDTGYNSAKPVFSKTQLKYFGNKVMNNVAFSILDECKAMRPDNYDALYCKGYEDAVRHITNFIITKDNLWDPQPRANTPAH